MSLPIDEEWRPVVGYEGYYEVSDQGRVRSLDRAITRQDGTSMRCRGKILKQHLDDSGRFQLGLTRDGHGQTRRVHGLVLEAFVGPRPDGMEACHSDGNCRNNHVSNLRWGTHAENMEDRVRHGVYARSGDYCPAGHLYDRVYFRRSRPIRFCRECARVRQRKTRAAARAAALGAEVRRP